MIVSRPIGTARRSSGPTARVSRASTDGRSGGKPSKAGLATAGSSRHSERWPPTGRATSAGRVAEQPDGTYKVRLNEAEWTRDGAAPTGQMIDLTVTPDLPVFDARPELSAFARRRAHDMGAGTGESYRRAGSDVDTAATGRLGRSLAPVVRKRRRRRKSQESSDRIAPEGYVRLNQGSTSLGSR